MTVSLLDGPLAAIRVDETMHLGVLVCSRETPLSTVARAMAEHAVHAMVVSDDLQDPSALWGVVSDLDLVAAASVRDLDEQTAGGTAATPALLIGGNDSLQRAAQIMTEHAVTHLIVVDPESTRPVGVLSTLDLARALAGAAAARSSTSRNG
jgi:CBS domain-containing protein